MGAEAGRGWVDVSRPLKDGLPVWPGDRPFQMHRRSEGGLVISWFQTTCHVGTHVDAPLHVMEGGAPLEEIPLERFLGPVEVVETPGHGDRIRREDLPAGWVPAACRVFFRTGCCPAGMTGFPAAFPGLEVALVEWLADRNVVLVGLDAPSVDPPDSKQLPAHRALAERDMTWIEGLELAGVGPGLYEMVGLPLPLAAAEAAPIRVLLRPVSG